MNDGKLSQEESKKLAKHMREEMNFTITDQKAFWRYTPEQTAEELHNKYGVTLTASEVKQIIGAE